MPDGLYERDALAWSEQQAGLLRRLAHGERVNDAVDWPNVVEEIEAMGRSEVRACVSMLRLVIEHVLKAHAWPDSQAVAHWRSEIVRFLADLQDCFSPSMRQRISVDDEYARVLRIVMAGASAGMTPVPAACPFVLDDFLAKDADASVLLRILVGRKI